MIITVNELREMTVRDKKKLVIDDLITLIFSLDDKINQEDKDKEIQDLKNAIATKKEETVKNTAAILEINSIQENHKVNDWTVPRQNDMTRQNEILAEIDKIKMEINEIQQYLRINNIEVVGIPEKVIIGNEEILLDTENSLIDFFNNELNLNIAAHDIDICHEIPSRRLDEKRVVVCKFISRKDKIDIKCKKK